MADKVGKVFPSEDSEFTLEIMRTHNDFGTEKVDVKEIFSMVKHILLLMSKRSTLGVNSNSWKDGDEIVKAIADPINKIYFEIVYKCADNEEHLAAKQLLQSLSNYSWDVKGVIALAAFSINYGEFWLVRHLNNSYQLAKDLADLMDSTLLTTNTNELNRKLEKISKLLDVLLNIADCIRESCELPQESSLERGIAIAVYWIMRSLLGCASTLQNFFSDESMEILDKDHSEANSILECFQDQLRKTKDSIERKNAEQAYEEVKRSIRQSACGVNMDVLKVLIRSKEDQKPLYNGSNRKKEQLEELQLKHVLLLISDLHFPMEQLNTLRKIYAQNKTTKVAKYKLLWLPISDKTRLLPEEESLFYELRDQMDWYSVDQPSVIDPAVVRYIRENWDFKNVPKLVVLDPRGNRINQDALPMLWVWRGNAFPLTSAREEGLWKECAWNAELLAGGIGPIPEWIKENRVICLFGGDDTGEFTQTLQSVADALNVALGMLYVGKMVDSQNKVRQNELSAEDIWYFWERLSCMRLFLEKHGMKNENVAQGLSYMLDSRSSEKGWAVFSSANNEMTKGNLEMLLPVLKKYTEWGDEVDHPDKFVRVLGGFVHHCNRLLLPYKEAPDRVSCADCRKIMEKYFVYK